VAPATDSATTAAASLAASLAARELDAFFGASRVVRDVTVDFHEREVTAIIGPSGCGKSTLLRCLNRMHETVPGARVEGEVLFDGQDVYGPSVSAIKVRRQIGMVFQRPTPFPTMSIRDNVLAGLQVTKRSERPSRATSALGLSGGQQQRLCIARALATNPAILLLDEPTASLDPISTQRVEELVYELRSAVTVIIVTHNMQQAARISDRTAFMLLGELVEVAPTKTMFTAPKDQRSEAYITGRFG
jgi:phosphate transport system ATP-binding protein